MGDVAILSKLPGDAVGSTQEALGGHFRSGLTYGTQETTGSIESFHGRWKARLVTDGKGDIRSRRMDWLIHDLSFFRVEIFRVVGHI